MRAMLNTMKTHLLQGENLVLVTVVASSGATPRGAGARMLVGPQGRITGTIGGGAVEYRSEQIAREVLAEGQSRNHQFSLTKDDVQNLGMICGGNVTVYFYYLPANDPEILALAEDAEARTSEKAIIDVEPLFADEEDDMFSDPTTVSDGAYYYSYGDVRMCYRTDLKNANWSASVQDEDGNWVVVETFTGVYFEVDLSDYSLVKITRTWPGVLTSIYYFIPLHLPQSGDPDGRYVVTFYDRDTVVGTPYVDNSTWLLKGGSADGSPT